METENTEKIQNNIDTYTNLNIVKVNKSIRNDKKYYSLKDIDNPLDFEIYINLYQYCTPDEKNSRKIKNEYVSPLIINTDELNGNIITKVNRFNNSNEKFVSLVFDFNFDEDIECYNLFSSYTDLCNNEYDNFFKNYENTKVKKYFDDEPLNFNFYTPSGKATSDMGSNIIPYYKLDLKITKETNVLIHTLGGKYVKMKDEFTNGKFVGSLDVEIKSVKIYPSKSQYKKDTMVKSIVYQVSTIYLREYKEYNNEYVNNENKTTGQSLPNDNEILTI